MEEQILEVKNLYINKINKELFFKLLLNVINGYDGYKEPMRAYANYLNVENWKILFSNPNLHIDITENQLVLFFNYMVKYHPTFFGKDRDEYYVSRDFMNNELRRQDRFPVEAILLTAFEIL